MSTVQGMFSERDVEAQFAPAGCVRLGVGHYRRMGENSHALLLEEPPPPLPEKRLASKPKHVAIEIIALTYGDFMDVATGIGADPQKLWDWATGLK